MTRPEADLPAETQVSAAYLAKNRRSLAASAMCWPSNGNQINVEFPDIISEAMNSALFAGIYGHLPRMLLMALLLGSVVPQSAYAKGDLAEQHYSRGLAFYDSKDYPSAIREFQAAYKIRQLPRILLNIGQVYRKLGMASTALKFYEHYLRVDPKAKPEIKAEVDRYIAMTRAMLDPPPFEAVDAKSAKAAAAAAVAAAPSNVTPVASSDPYDLEASSKPVDAKTAPLGKPSDKQPGDRTATTGTLPLSAQPNPTPGTSPELKTFLPPTTPEPTQLNLTQAPPVDKPVQKPFYKQPLFWGVIGGAVAAVTITGIAVGVSQSNAVPSTVLHPTK